MAATSTTKLAPRVSKTPDPDFTPEYDPLFDPTYNSRQNAASQRPIAQQQSTGSWTFVWMLLILIVAGFVAYRFYDNTNAPTPVAGQTTTTTDPNATATTPPPAGVPAAPPAASTTAPDQSAAPADGSTAAPQVPATTHSP